MVIPCAHVGQQQLGVDPAVHCTPALHKVSAHRHINNNSYISTFNLVIENGPSAMYTIISNPQ